MTQKNYTSQLFFFTLSAVAGFLIALILYYLLQNNTNEQITPSDASNAQEESVDSSIDNNRAIPGQIVSFAPAVNRAAPSVVNILFSLPLGCPKIHLWPPRLHPALSAWLGYV